MMSIIAPERVNSANSSSIHLHSVWLGPTDCTEWTHIMTRMTMIWSLNQINPPSRCPVLYIVSWCVFSVMGIYLFFSIPLHFNHLQIATKGVFVPSPHNHSHIDKIRATKGEYILDCSGAFSPQHHSLKSPVQRSSQVSHRCRHHKLKYQSVLLSNKRPDD